MRPMYSPRIPMPINCTPPKNSTAKISDV